MDTYMIILLASCASLGLACFVALGGLPGERLLSLPEVLYARASVRGFCTGGPQLAYAYAAPSYSSTSTSLESRWAWLRAEPKPEAASKPTTSAASALHAFAENSVDLTGHANVVALIGARMQALHMATAAASRVGGAVEHEDHGSSGLFTIWRDGGAVAKLAWRMAGDALAASWVMP